MVRNLNSDVHIRFSFPPLPQQANRGKMRIRLSIANKAQIQNLH